MTILRFIQLLMMTCFILSCSSRSGPVDPESGGNKPTSPVELPVDLDKLAVLSTILSPANDASIGESIVQVKASTGLTNIKLKQMSLLVDGDMIDTDTDGEPWIFSWPSYYWGDNKQYSLTLQMNTEGGNIVVGVQKHTVTVTDNVNQQLSFAPESIDKTIADTNHTDINLTEVPGVSSYELWVAKGEVEKIIQSSTTAINLENLDVGAYNLKYRAILDVSGNQSKTGPWSKTTSLQVLPASGAKRFESEVSQNNSSKYNVAFSWDEKKNSLYDLKITSDVANFSPINLTSLSDNEAIVKDLERGAYTAALTRINEFGHRSQPFIIYVDIDRIENNFSIPGYSCAIDKSFDAVTERIESFMTKHSITAGTVTIGKGLGHKANIVYSRGFGTMNGADRVPKNALFRLGQLDELITYYALETLIQYLLQNERPNPVTLKPFSLKDKVFDLFRFYGVVSGEPKDPALDLITFEHLLTHKSGLVKLPLPNTPAFADIFNETNEFTKKSMVEWVYQQLLLFKPNEVVPNIVHEHPGIKANYLYSTVNYALVRYLFEIASTDFISFVQESVFAPINTRDIHIAHGSIKNRVRNIYGISREPEDYIGSPFDDSSYLESTFSLVGSSEAITRLFQHKERYYFPIQEDFFSSSMSGNQSYVYEFKFSDGRHGVLTILLNKSVEDKQASKRLIDELSHILSSIQKSVFVEFETPSIGVYRDGKFILDTDYDLKLTENDTVIDGRDSLSRPFVLTGASCGGTGAHTVIGTAEGRTGNGLAPGSWLIRYMGKESEVNDGYRRSLLYGGNTMPLSFDGKVSEYENDHFYVDRNYNFTWDWTIDSKEPFGRPGHLPVVGRWKIKQTSDDLFGYATDSYGIFKNGWWYLDIDEDAQVTSEDIRFHFGQEGDLPFAADFNLDGIDEVGTFRQGYWFIDMNGNHEWDAEDATRIYGQEGDIPVVSPTKWLIEYAE